MLIKFVKNIVPWLITIAAIYFIFTKIDLKDLLLEISSANLSWIFITVLLTFISYILRSLRWNYFFNKHYLTKYQAISTLFIGFMMNNIIPARGGELIRAHICSKIIKKSRTITIASIFSERICDGVTLSIIFLSVFLFFGFENVSKELIYVAILFSLALIFVFIILAFRQFIINLYNKFNVDNKYINYIFEKIMEIVDGLKPLKTKNKIFFIILFSFFIWISELLAFYSIMYAFNVIPSLNIAVMFLIAVNFSSLIPAAPGAWGVIEAIVPSILVPFGIAYSKGLSMTITQHLIQYLVVCIPGIIFFIIYNRKNKK